MIEQLWFGWSEVGLEGSNLQQIIAASPGLADPRSPMTQEVLRYCYSATEPTTGWCQANGIRVIFRRTPLGLDGRGRPGSYFVHALAGGPDELRSDRIGAILGSDLLLSQAPATLCTTLDRIPEPSIAPARTSPPEGGIEAVAHYLANLAAGRLTTLRVASEDAVPLAAFVTRLMPASLGLVGFSEREAAGDSAQYDITLAPAPSPLFAEVDPAAGPPNSWRYAAQLLLDAADGNGEAAGCIDVLAASATSRRDFTVTLGHWCAIERGTIDAITTEALSWLDSKPALRRRVTRLAALDTIVELAVQGHRVAAAVLEHCLTVDGAPVLGAVCEALDGGIALGLDRLVSTGAHTLSRAVVGQIAQAEIDLAPLTLDRQRAILALFAADDQLSMAVQRLLENVGLAVSIVGDPQLPTAWQVYAARRHAARLPREAISNCLSQRPDIVGRLCEPKVPGSLFDQIGAAIAGFDVALALRVRDSAAEYVPARVDRQWWMDIYQRLNPLGRLNLLGRSGLRPRYVPAAATADACARAIEWCAGGGVELPTINLLLRVLDVRDHDHTSRALFTVCAEIQRLGAPGLAPGRPDLVLRRVQRLHNPNHRWAMTELLVWRLLEAPEPSDFRRGMRGLEELEPVADTAARVLRAADILVQRWPLVAIQVISWTVEVLDTGQPEEILATMQPNRVRRLLNRSGQQASAAALRHDAHTKAAHRWLDEVLPQPRRGLFGWPW